MKRPCAKPYDGNMRQSPGGYWLWVPQLSSTTSSRGVRVLSILQPREGTLRLLIFSLIMAPIYIREITMGAHSCSEPLTRCRMILRSCY